MGRMEISNKGIAYPGKPGKALVSRVQLLRLGNLPTLGRWFGKLDSFNSFNELRIVRVRIKSHPMPVAFVKLCAQQRLSKSVKLACVGLRRFIKDVEADSILSLVHDFFT